MNAGDIKFGEWIEKGFNLYKENFGLVVLASLIAVALSVVTAGILAGPMMAGVCLITLQLVDGKDPKPEAGMVFKGFNYFLNAFLFIIAWGVALIVVSFIVGIVPCVGQLAALFIIWAVQTALMFGMFFIVDEEMEFWPASMKSFETVKTAFWPFLGFFIVTSLIGSIGAIACGIGVVITAPIQGCMLAVAYREVFKPKNAQAGENKPLEESRPTEEKEKPAE
ncbi:MAG: hypothetical protein KKB94_07815 [Proteobacteria bacterium]|nr:hypothetical protein [Pseudomonadota bacterium]